MIELGNASPEAEQQQDPKQIPDIVDSENALSENDLQKTQQQDQIQQPLQAPQYLQQRHGILDAVNALRGDNAAILPLKSKS